MSNLLKEDDVKHIINIEEDQIDMDLIVELFVHRKNNPAKYNMNDKFELPKGNLYNDKIIITTVGRYIVNKLLLMPNIIKHTGYINETLDSNNIGKLESQLADLLLNDLITVEDFIMYIDKSQWLGYTASHVVSPGFGYDIIVPLESVMKRKEELVKEHRKALDDNDPVIASQIEKELVDLAEKELRDNNVRGMEYYDSGTSKGLIA